MTISLPIDLYSAEAQALESLKSALRDCPKRLWSVGWAFEGLRLMPVALRLRNSLQQHGYRPLFLWPDAGSAALARRDVNNNDPKITDFRNYLAEGSTIHNDIIVVVAPQPSDYEQVVSICDRRVGACVILNGRLENAAVGIGSIARENRRNFLSIIGIAYQLQPLDSGALLRAYPQDWALFRADPDGYRLVDTFKTRPDFEAINAALLDSRNSLVRQVTEIERFLEGLQH
ncbi:hypothetical protein OMCYN_01377 [cyanobiont of Ornithocercus magnificus]|nr:hypothetical protein OMCYN_01377 [cyanobiont of Ornithocercus magnificus]